tara:strand:- start:700 stop:804 length:105 start_codon:yes stop_codon:yes gene_type:complete
MEYLVSIYIKKCFWVLIYPFLIKDRQKLRWYGPK